MLDRKTLINYTQQKAFCDDVDVENKLEIRRRSELSRFRIEVLISLLNGFTHSLNQKE